MLELDMIVNNVELGYPDQRSANAARMELDREGIALDDEQDWLDDED